MAQALNAILARAVDAGDVAHAAAIVTDGSDIRFEAAIGPRSLADPRPLGLETVYWVHSMTKPITAAGVMLLVEAGKLDLDADCADILPSLAGVQVLEGFDGAGKPKLRPAKGTITLRRLLTHTAGFAYDFCNENQMRWIADRGLTRDDLFNDPRNLPPLAFDPGAKWEYGVNIDFAGKVVEAVTGQTLAAYLKERVLDPLGMGSTGYITTPDIRDRLAGVHVRTPDGAIKAHAFEPPVDPDPASFNGGGGMFSTARDYARFMDMILNDGRAADGGQFLQTETVRQMASNQIGDVRVRPMPPAMPRLSFGFDFFPETPKGWGLSFMMNLEDVPAKRKAGSLSWAGLRNTYFWIDRESGLAAALFTQMLPFADPKTLDLLNAFESGVYAAFAKQ